MKHCIEQGYCTCVTGNCIAIQFKELEAQLEANTILYKNLVKRYGELEAQLEEMTLNYSIAVKLHRPTKGRADELEKQLEAVRGVVTEFDCKPIKYSSVSKSFLYQRMLSLEKCLKAAIGEESGG